MTATDQSEGTSVVHPAMTQDATVLKPIKFHFKETKDEAGKKTGYKRKSLDLNIPVPSAVALGGIIANGVAAYQFAIPEGAAVPPEVMSQRKQLDLLLEATNDIIYTHARTQVNANEEITQETLDVGKLSWEFIALIPPTERKGTGIADETWDDFVKDYVAIMPDALKAQGVLKKPEQIETQAKILKSKFNSIKGQKKILGYMRQMLAIWYQHTQQKDEMQTVYDYLDNRADVLGKADEQQLLENI